MGYPLARDRLINRRGGDAPEANMGAGHRRDRPRKTPAVAVEHRQGPQIDRMVPYAPDESVAERVEIGATVVIDDPLRIAGGARGVVERDRVPFILGRHFREGRVAARDERFVIHLAEELATRS